MCVVLALLVGIGAPAAAQTDADDLGRGEIRSRSGRSVWVWNGQTLRPKFGGRSQDVWQFDGRKISRLASSDAKGSSPDNWIWTGTELRPAFAANSDATYVYDDDGDPQFRPKFGASHAETWRLSGGTWKPRQGATLDNTWTVKGDVPAAVIGMVVLGLVE